MNAQIKKETIDFNNNRIDNAENENEVWNVAKDIINPKKENSWSMKIENEIIEDHQQIADEFNNFFVKKIEDLKANIDKDNVTDPLESLNI